MILRPEEIRTPREVMRALNRELPVLASGALSKIVVMKGNEPQAVILSPERYAQLIDNDPFCEG